jgi:hypothetical protein
MSLDLRMSLYAMRTGQFLTTIQAQPTISWVRNAYGMCSFELSLNDAKSVRRYLEFGTLVYVESPLGLAWGGVLDPDMDWNDDGTIRLNAYSAEYLLSFRRSPLNQLWRGASAGALFKQFIDGANLQEDLLIREGNIWRGGTPAEDTMDSKDFYTHTKALAVNRKNDFYIEPVIDAVNYRLSFTANYYERRGQAKALALREGLNVEKRGTTLKVQRKIVNDLLGIGAGSDSERPTWVETDADSRSRYGLRQGSEDFSGNSDPATLKANTVEKLRTLRYPRNSFRLALLDVGSAFQEVRIGNVHPLQMHTVGFLSDGTIGVDTQVEIQSMRWLPENKVELGVEEVF